jgi:hypothetical protein
MEYALCRDAVGLRTATKPPLGSCVRCGDIYVARCAELSRSQEDPSQALDSSYLDA